MQWIAGLITGVIYSFIAIQFEFWLFRAISNLFENADVGVLAGLVAVVIAVGPLVGIGLFIVMAVVALVTVFTTR